MLWGTLKTHLFYFFFFTFHILAMVWWVYNMHNSYPLWTFDQYCLGQQGLEHFFRIKQTKWPMPMGRACCCVAGINQQFLLLWLLLLHVTSFAGNSNLFYRDGHCLSHFLPSTHIMATVPLLHWYNSSKWNACVLAHALNTILTLTAPNKHLHMSQFNILVWFFRTVLWSS